MKWSGPLETKEPKWPFKGMWSTGLRHLWCLSVRFINPKDQQSSCHLLSAEKEGKKLEASPFQGSVIMMVINALGKPQWAGLQRRCWRCQLHSLQEGHLSTRETVWSFLPGLTQSQGSLRYIDPFLLNHWSFTCQITRVKRHMIRLHHKTLGQWCIVVWTGEQDKETWFLHNAVYSL